MKSRTLEIKQAKIGEFQRNRLNPKNHDSRQLSILGELLEKFGVVGGIIVYRSERNNNEWTLFDGHGRQEVDPDTIFDVTYTDLTDEDADKLSMMYDRVASQATPDVAIEAKLLKNIKLSGPLLEFAKDIAVEDGISVEILAGLTDINLEGDVVDNPYNEWEDMPEFEQEDLSPVKSIKINFASMEDYKSFALLINQKLTDKTISTWYPEAEIGSYKDKVYIDES